MSKSRLNFKRNIIILTENFYIGSHPFIHLTFSKRHFFYQSYFNLPLNFVFLIFNPVCICFRGLRPSPRIASPFDSYASTKETFWVGLEREMVLDYGCFMVT